MTVTLAEAAARYAAQGLWIFPLVPGTKDPFPRTAGFKDASTKQHIVSEWWGSSPDANIGCAPGRSGFVVIDIDGPDGEAEAGRLGLLAEPTLEATTGREDGGRHRWYRHPGGAVIGNRPLKPRLDVRADAGYVVLPPSVHPSGRLYRWRGRFKDVAVLPPNVAALLCEQQQATTKTPVPSRILAGQRNAELTRIAGAVRRVGCSEDLILAAIAGINRSGAVTPPLADRELEAIAKSVARYPTPEQRPFELPTAGKFKAPPSGPADWPQAHRGAWAT